MGKYTTLVREVREEKKRSKALYCYVYKHSIYIDNSVVATNPHLISATPLRCYAVDAVAPESTGATPLRPNAVDAIAPSPEPGPQSVAELFANPPDWLHTQLAMYYRARGERLLRPLVAAVRLWIAMQQAPDVSPTVALRSAPNTTVIRPAVVRELGGAA